MRLDFYTQQEASLAAQIKHLRHRNRNFVTGEIISFIAFIGFIAAYTVTEWGIHSIIASLLSLVAYITIRYTDTKNSERIERLENKRKVYEKELKYFAGDFSCFDAGERYVNPAHPYSFDMDIFGENSLFNRINRTVTTGGSDNLAQSLIQLPAKLDVYPSNRLNDTTNRLNDSTNRLNDTANQLNEKRNKISQLSVQEQLRTEFMSYGQNGLIQTASVLKALDEIKNIKEPSFARSRGVYILALTSLVFFALLIISAITGTVSYSAPLKLAILQLIVSVAACAKPMKSIYRTLNSLHNHLKTYIELIRIAKNENIFSELEAIIDAIDNRSNEIGIVIFNMLYMNDFFIIRRFFRWRKKGLEQIKQNIDEISELDALISMATFRYNNPQANDAEIVTDQKVVYQAEALSHPFLGTKAVPNDFNIADNNYYIVTGANMAGKSTFLRSLGINYILAMNGMPVFAKSMKVSVFSLFSSMRTTDDLTHGISYFNAELLRLRQLLEHCHQHPRTLIILDEILKGTNSLDKLNGSRLFLQEISKYPVSGVIATHDLELSKMCDEQPERFHNYCFEIKLEDNITYTYKITPGVARNQNATYLLKNIINGV